jgi:hypothetical protein
MRKIINSEYDRGQMALVMRRLSPRSRLTPYTDKSTEKQMSGLPTTQELIRSLQVLV